MAALLRVRRHSCLRPSLHADDDRADLQLDDADRPIADRGRQRCGRQYIAGAVDGHSAAVENRDRNRLDIRHRHGDGRLCYRRRARRRAGHLGRQADRHPTLLSPVPAGRCQCDDPIAGGHCDDCPPRACRRHPQGAVRMRAAARPPIFYGLAVLFGLFVVFLYGPIATIVVLAFQGPEGGLVFPMNGVSVHWFGDIWGAFDRSTALGAIVMVATVLFSFLAGLAFRRRFPGATALFYVVIASLVMPSVVVSLGIGAMFEMLGIERAWYSSALGAHLTWTLPFGLLIMLAVFNRFILAYEEAARDLGARGSQTIRYVVVPIIAPSLVGVALFGFTLSYDEIARTSQSVGALNTLPLELAAMQTNATTPVIYALGAMTTGLSFLVIGACLLGVIAVRRRRKSFGSDAGQAV